MSSELETAGLASAGGLSPGGKADLSGQPCRNCGTEVTGRHCPQCGQLAASFHRPFLSLIADSISDTLALDGRIARTLPLLLFRPGVLTRRYIEGKRARYVPPFRLFLLSSLIFYLLVFGFLGQARWLDDAAMRMNDGYLSEEEMTALREEVIRQDGSVDQEQLEALLRHGPEAADGATDGEASGDMPVEEILAEAGTTDDPLAERVLQISENPRLFMMAVETWTPRLSLLLVPLTMLVMALMYAWHRRIYVYDHAIHALHLHSWMYLTATLAILLGFVIGSQAALLLFLAALPFYVTLSLKAAYRSGYLVSLARMIFLFVFWTVALALLLVGVFIASAFSL